MVKTTKLTRMEATKLIMKAFNPSFQGGCFVLDQVVRCWWNFASEGFWGKCVIINFVAKPEAQLKKINNNVTQIQPAIKMGTILSPGWRGNSDLTADVKA